MPERLHFVLGGCVGEKYPRQRPHCSVELKRRGRCSCGDHLCIIIIAFNRPEG